MQKEENIYVIVTDGQWHKSLSAIRSLGKRGYKVVVLGDSVFTTGFYSRFAYQRKRMPEVKADKRRFHKGFQKIYRQLSENGKVVVLPMETDTLLYFAESARCRREKLYYSMPDISKILLAENKAASLKAAAENGIPCPYTLYSRTFEEFTYNLTKIEGSYVIKPVRGSGSKGVLYSDHISGMDLKKHWDSYGRLLIQERVPADGKGVGVEVLMNGQHECVAFFCHERIRQYPNSGGPSTHCKSAYHAQLIQQSISLLKALQWVGVAMVEWKEDTQNGGYKFMEINPRFWGSLELSSRCGINFPELYVRQALGERLPACNVERPCYEIGKACRWMFPGEILRYLTDKERERPREFLRGIVGSAEEWDREDISGFVASFFCPALLALNPKYWKYIIKK